MCWTSTYLYPGDKIPRHNSVEDNFDMQERWYITRSGDVYAEHHEMICTHTACTFRAGPCVFHPENCNCDGDVCWKEKKSQIEEERINATAARLIAEAQELAISMAASSPYREFAPSVVELVEARD